MNEDQLHLLLLILKDYGVNFTAHNINHEVLHPRLTLDKIHLLINKEGGFSIVELNQGEILSTKNKVQKAEALANLVIQLEKNYPKIEEDYYILSEEEFHKLKSRLYSDYDIEEVLPLGHLFKIVLNDKPYFISDDLFRDQNWKTLDLILTYLKEESC